MHIFELDRLLSQMVQDCLNSLQVSSLPVINTSTVSFQTNPQHQQTRPISSNSSSSNKSTTPVRKTIECLYMTPTVNKQQAPLAPHCHSTLNIDRRPKSASNIILASQNCISRDTHKYQRSTDKNFHIKMHRSEDDLIVAMQRNQQDTTINSNNDDTLILYGNKNEYQQPNVQELTKKFEQKTNLVSDHSQIINNDKKEKDDDELSWPQQPLSIQTSGIKKFVRNSLKLFIIQPQQHKRTGK